MFENRLHETEIQTEKTKDKKEAERECTLGWRKESMNLKVMISSKLVPPFHTRNMQDFRCKSLAPNEKIFRKTYLQTLDGWNGEKEGKSR